MARIRTVKPEFWRHPVMARLDDDFQLLALSLLTMADDEGYFRAEAALIRGDVQPFRENLPRISRGLEELVRVGWIEVSRHPEQGDIGRVKEFVKHQRVHNPTPSKLREYFTRENIGNISRAVTEEIPLEQGTGNREQGKEQEEESCAAASAAPSPSKAVASLPANQAGKFYQITQAQVDGWKELYPAVDVMQELRNMRGWLDANPKNRKTSDGMARFINHWLKKEQNRAPVVDRVQQSPAERRLEANLRANAACKERLRATQGISHTVIDAEFVTRKPVEKVTLPDLDKRAGEKTWAYVSEGLRRKINAHSYDTWIKPMRALGADDTTLFVAVPTTEFLYVAEKFRAELAELTPGFKLQLIPQEAIA